MSFSIWILSGANLETVTHWVSKINCLQLRVRNGGEGGWTHGDKWQSTSGEMPCLGWCTGNRLLPARKWSGKHRPAYISPLALRRALLVLRHQGSAFVRMEPIVNIAAAFLKDLKYLWWLSGVSPWGLEFLRPPDSLPPGSWVNVHDVKGLGQIYVWVRENVWLHFKSFQKYRVYPYLMFIPNIWSFPAITDSYLFIINSLWRKWHRNA